MQKFPLLTPHAVVDISGQGAVVHALAPSHLPITKYIATGRDDAIGLHQRVCNTAATVWYADGSSRAGEGWAAAVEWILDPGRSGSKMRGCVGEGDALDAELGGICKAVEGFYELLQQSIKKAEPMAHELVVFCDSQAAIVSIDTASRPESLRFDKLWRSICSDFLQAHLTLVWMPHDGNIEGSVLANKIAVVGASNSYLKRKKDNVLPDIYRRPGGGEMAPGGSTEAGPWQRGDGDPSRRKSPFERPKPLPIAPDRLSTYPEEEEPNELRLEFAGSQDGHGLADHAESGDVEDEATQPREGSIFVTQ